MQIVLDQRRGGRHGAAVHVIDEQHRREHHHHDDGTRHARLVGLRINGGFQAGVGCPFRYDEHGFKASKYRFGAISARR